jgi:AraC family transcriptional regulator of adaptative response/methylated-DNA-[protein]-cysteine methyltransferase
MLPQQPMEFPPVAFRIKLEYGWKIRRLPMGSMKQAHLSDIVAIAGTAKPSAQPAPATPGFELRWSIGETPFGAALAAATPFGLCAFEFLGGDVPLKSSARETLLKRLAARWSDARLVADDFSASANAPKADAPLASALIAAAFEAVTSGFPSASAHASLPLHLRGTAFQLSVWQRLLAIPAGGLVTYGELAASLGRPNAARAVGSAVGANTIAIFVPCHRVVAASGALGGYRWGSALKAALIEGERRDPVSAPSI